MAITHRARSGAGNQAIRDTASCKAWLATLSPPDSADSLARIEEVMADIGQGTLASEVRMDLADCIRTVIFKALRDRVRDGEFRSIPIAPAEAEVIWLLIDATQALRDLYEAMITRLPAEATKAVQGAGGHAAVPSRKEALHRAIDLNAHILVLHLRMRVAVPDPLWERHCRLGQLVRDLECQDDEFGESTVATLTANCRTAFLTPVLVALADPTQLSAPEFQGALDMALHGGKKAGFRIDAVTSEVPTARPQGNPGPVIPLAGGTHQVRLDTVKLIKGLERRSLLLAEGKTPHRVGLSSEIPPAIAKALLVSLARRWAPAVLASIDFPEQVWRESVSEFALAVADLTGSGDGARSPKSAAPTYDYMRIRDDALTRSKGEVDRERVFRLLDDAETWNVTGETADSILFMRRHSKPRIGLSQLIGVKLGGRPGPIPFLLGSIAGLQQGIHENEQGVARPTSTHLVRIRLLQGVPMLIRASGEGIELDPAFLMMPKNADDEVDTTLDRIRTDPGSFSMVLPHMAFRTGRVLRVVIQGRVENMRLEALVARGSDFDQSSLAIP